MQASADNFAFAPPPEPAAVRGFVLAVIAHLLLLIALSGLITWQNDDQSSVVQAELWSRIPQEAAPPPPAPTPAQPPRPQVQPQPKEVQPAPPPPVAKQPDISVEREKKKREEEAKRRAEDERRREQLEAQKRKLEEQKLAEEKTRKEELAKQEKEKQLREKSRQDQLARMQALAAGSGSPTSQGVAQQSSGPSASYASKLAGIFKRNMHFPVDGIAGNPKVQVQVRVAPGGIILGVQVTKPSGNQAWDDAVVRAIENTSRIPPDEHGKWITEFPLTWGPKDV
ncbi:MAG TPA: cell envelope integrity protein TolA [Ramlibacter sp.]|nr:cell envelope integrity protein TolA [Ramlibacter sp.]